MADDAPSPTPHALSDAALAADARDLAARALAEDGRADLTTEVVGGSGPVSGTLIARTPAVLAGMRYADEAAGQCGCRIEWLATDGDALGAGAVVAQVHGTLQGVLRAERPLLNFLQRASGIATATRGYVEAVRGTACRILHTRKTAPGLRLLDVTAVLAGGGHLHRLGLDRVVMLKDNHWAALEAVGRDLAEACRQARARGAVAVHVEVESEAQVRLACAAGADRLLVDNQPPETFRRLAELARRLGAGIEIEGTGGITLENVAAYARAGADFVSVGALTHSVQAADLALEIESADRGIGESAARR